MYGKVLASFIRPVYLDKSTWKKPEKSTEILINAITRDSDLTEILKVTEYGQTVQYRPGQTHKISMTSITKLSLCY